MADRKSDHGDHLGFLAELVMAECDDRDRRRAASKFHRLTVGLPIRKVKAVERMAPAAEVRVWRSSWPGRIGAWGFFAMFVALAIVWLVARAPVWLHLLALLPAAAAVIPLRVAGAKVVLTSDWVGAVRSDSALAPGRRMRSQGQLARRSRQTCGRPFPRGRRSPRPNNRPLPSP